MRILQRQWTGQGILFLLGMGVELMPHPNTWLFTVIIWGVAFVWFCITSIYWFVNRHRFRIEQKVSEIRDLTSLLPRYFEYLGNLVEVTSLETTKANTEQLNEDIKDMWRLDAKKIAQLPSIVDENIKDAVLHNTLKQVKEPFLSKGTTAALSDLGGIMNENQLGLSAIKDKKSRKLENEIKKKRKYIESKELNDAITDYLMWTFGINSLLLFIKQPDADAKRILPAQWRANMANIKLITNEHMHSLLVEINKLINREIRGIQNG